MTFEELDQLVISWGRDKDLIKRENSEKQFMKFIEEVFEFKTEMDKVLWLDKIDEPSRYDVNKHLRKLKDMKLEMGDILVTLIILSAQLDIDLTECLEMAYEKISKRKGKTINGIFVKLQDSKKELIDKIIGQDKDLGTVFTNLNEKDIVKLFMR